MASTTMGASWRTTLADHITVTKPRIIVLIALTTWAAMSIAAPGQSSGDLVFFTLLGTALAVASAHTFNATLERDLDAKMNRTKRRPIVQGRMDPRHAIRYASVLAIISFVIMVWKVNVYSALLAQLGLWFYVGIYTVLLKRRTALNTVIGGIAGSIPPLIGWAAATGKLDAAAMMLFAIMVMWQPPHFYALTLFQIDDYRRAGFPMVAVVSGPTEAARQIAWYATAMVLLSFTLYYPLGVTGVWYLITAAVIGVVYIALAWRAVRELEHAINQWGRRLFGYSMLYLAILFIAMVLDVQG